MDYLYHYTSLEALKCILENETIRLKPLSTLDDMEEALSKDCKGIGDYVFVSSWSGEQKEMIPMWYMYGDSYKGVRIGLPKMPFRRYQYTPLEQRNHGVIPNDEKDLEIDLPLKDVCNPNYIVSPFKRDHQLIEVLYDNDPDLLIRQLWYDTDEAVSFSYGKMGKYKNKYWSFQKEWRYIVTIMPISFDMANKYIQYAPERLKDFFEKVSSGVIPCPFDHYDLSIDNEMLSKMEITLGPLMSEEDRVTVHRIINEKGCPILVKDSELDGRIRSNH